MKSLTLALSLAVGTALLLDSPTAALAKAHSVGAKRGHKTPVRGKSQAVKKVYLPADLFVRLRCGLSLAKPAPVEAPLPPAPLSPAAERPTGEPAAAAPVAAGPGLCDLQSLATDQAPASQAESPSKRKDRTQAALSQTAEPPAAVPDSSGSEATPPADAAASPEPPEPSESDEQLQRRSEIYRRFAEQVHWYEQRIPSVRQALERARPYLHLIAEELEKRRLPLDLALLPILESGYQARAESPKEASGIWQFVSGTGKDYGLKQSDNYDGRFDIAESTRAAATYLSDLRERFDGDLLLALASYNCGQGRVEEAMAANRKAGLPTDFWSLSLPAETMAYVPRLLALSEIFGHPERYGLKLRPVPNQPYLARVKFKHILPVEHVSRLADLDMETFLLLNPGFINGVVGIDGPYDLLLPRKNVEAFGRNLDLILHPPQRVTPLFDLATPFPPLIRASFPGSPIDSGEPRGGYHPLSGEDYGMGARWLVIDGYLADAAGRRAENAPQAEPQKNRGGKAGRAPGSRKEPREEIHYVHEVGAGENAEIIAQYYKLDAKSIRSRNKLKPRQRLEPGQKLIIPLEPWSPEGLLAREAAPQDRKAPSAEPTQRRRSAGRNSSSS